MDKEEAKKVVEDWLDFVVDTNLDSASAFDEAQEWNEAIDANEAIIDAMRILGFDTTEVDATMKNVVRS